MDPEKLRALLSEQLQHRQLVSTKPSTYDSESHSIECIATTENPVQVVDWERWAIIDEVILGSGIEIPGRGQVPMLDSHNRFSVGMILGSARDWKPGSPETTCRLFFSSTAEKAETLVREGHLTDVSIGYRCLESVWIPEGQTQKIGGRDFKGPVKVAVKTRIMEISPTPIGADENAMMRQIDPQVTSYLSARGLPPSATIEEMFEFIKRDTVNNQRKESPMTPEELAAQKKAEEERKAAEQKALDEARATAEKEARERVDSICTTAEQFRSNVAEMDVLKDQALKEGWPAERFYRETLNRMSTPKPANTPDPAATKATLRDFVKPWQRRSVTLLHAKVAEARGAHDLARSFMTKLDAQTRSMTDAQKVAEETEAVDKIRNSGLPEQQQVRLMSSLTGGAGGYLVPTPLLAEIFILVEKWGVARRYFRSIPMSADTLKLDSLTTEATAYWVTQGNNITAGDLGFGQGSLTVNKLAGIAAWSNEIDEDQAISLLPIFTESLSRAIYKKEDLAAFLGDGSGTYGGFTGLLNVAGKVTTMASTKTNINQADADILKTVRDSVNIDFRDGAMWWLMPDTVSLLEGLKDSQGRYIYREPAAGLPAMLWGYPIADSVGINALTQTTAISLKFAAFGNPKYMLMGQRRELDLVVSREGILDTGSAVTYNALQADGAIVRMTERVGFKAVLVNGLAVLRTAAS